PLVSRRFSPADGPHCRMCSGRRCQGRPRGRFCLADSDGLAIEKEEVIDVSVAFVKLELADGNGVVRGEVHFIAMLKYPSGRLELAVNLDASLFFRCVGATGRRHRRLPLFCSALHASAHEITVREVAAQSANTAAF